MKPYQIKSYQTELLAFWTMFKFSSFFHEIILPILIIKMFYFISWNYIILGFMFTFSLSIGLYYSVVSPQRSILDYFLARKKVGVVPTAISMFMSSHSGVDIFYVVGDIFLYDSMVLYVFVAHGLAHLIQSTFIVTLLNPLKIISVNEVSRTLYFYQLLLYVIFWWYANTCWIFGIIKKLLIPMKCFIFAVLWTAIQIKICSTSWNNHGYASNRKSLLIIPAYIKRVWICVLNGIYS